MKSSSLLSLKCSPFPKWWVYPDCQSQHQRSTDRAHTCFWTWPQILFGNSQPAKLTSYHNPAPECFSTTIMFNSLLHPSCPSHPHHLQPSSHILLLLQFAERLPDFLPILGSFSFSGILTCHRNNYPTPWLINVAQASPQLAILLVQSPNAERPPDQNQSILNCSTNW